MIERYPLEMDFRHGVLVVIGLTMAILAGFHISWNTGDPYRWLQGLLGLVLIPALFYGFTCENSSRVLVERRDDLDDFWNKDCPSYQGTFYDFESRFRKNIQKYNSDGKPI